MKRVTVRHFLQRFALWRAVVFFGLLPLAFACQKNQLIGLEVQPDGYLDSLILIDTFSVQAKTVYSDANNATRIQNFVGQLSNDEFGVSTASLYMNFALESENVYLEFPASTYTIEDIHLTVFPLNAYGDPSDSLDLLVYQIEEIMDIDSTYESDRSFRLDDNPLGSTRIGFESNEAISNLYVADPTDSNYVPYGGISIPLSHDLAAYLLQGIGTSYSTTSDFRAFFGGLAIVPTYAAGGEDGAIFNFDLARAGAGLSMTYSYVPADDPDTIIFETFVYDVSSSSTRFNSFSHDRSMSEVEKAVKEGFDAEYLYVQGMSGTKVEVQIPHLDKFASKSNAAVSLAELTFTIADLQPEALDHSPTLYLLDFDLSEDGTDSVETLTLDYTNSTLRHGGNLNGINGTYTFDVTREVQDILEQAEVGNDVNIGFTLNAQVPVLNGNVRYQNVLKGSDNIVFNLYFTDISE